MTRPSLPILLVLVLLGAASVGCGEQTSTPAADDASAAPGHTDLTPRPAPDPASAEPVAEPTEIVCPSGQFVGTAGGLLAEIPEGVATREEAVEQSTDEPYVMADHGRSALLLRDDGTAYKRVHVVRGTAGFYTAGYEECLDDDVRTVAEAELWCAAGEPVVRADAYGAPDATSVDLAVQPWTRPGDTTASTPDRVGQAVTVSQADGAAVLRLGVSIDGRRHRVFNVAACASRLPGLPTSEAVSTLDALPIGHCFVEPVFHDGTTYALPADEQLGTGGSLPDGWVGVGRLQPRAGNLRYVDAGGAELLLRPESEVAAPAGGCD